jgi:putative aldouronate transport system substrate-binding protein
MGKRLLSVSLVASVLLAAVLTGCEQNGNNTVPPAESQASARPESSANYYNDPGTFPIVKEKITLRVGVPTVPVIKDYKTNEVTRFLEKKTNIELVFEEYPLDEYVTKVDLMGAAGGADLPDILMLGGPAGNFSSTAVSNWGQAGMIVPLNKYFDKLAYHLRSAYEEARYMDYSTMLTLSASTDGNIYAVPSYGEEVGNQVGGGRMLIYKEWLDKLNMKKPTTLEGMRAYLEAVRDNDMNGNGNSKDEIPLTGFIGQLYQIKGAFLTPFLGSNGTDPWINREGKIEFTYNKEEYRQGIRYIKGLVDDKLLDPSFFTQDQAQMTAMITSSPHLVGAYGRSSYSNLPRELWPTYGVYAVALAGPDGKRHQTYWPPTPFPTFLITKNCKYPEAAFLFADYLASSEVSFINRYGFEGQDWRAMDPAKEVNLYNAKDPVMQTVNKWGSLQNTYWGGVGAYTNNASFAERTATMPNDPANADYIINEIVANLVKEAEPLAVRGTTISKLVYNEKENEIMQDIWAPIETYVNESFTRFVMSDMNLDTEWDAYVQTMNSMGLKEVLNAVQSSYDRMFK